MVTFGDPLALEEFSIVEKSNTATFCFDLDGFCQGTGELSGKHADVSLLSGL